MRRTDREITDFAQILRIIEACDVCRLALNDDGYPYILPLNFGVEVDGGAITLYFHGALEGKKHTLLRRDDRAGFEMDCGHRLVTDPVRGTCAMEYRSVVGRGRVAMVDEAERYRALCLLMRHYHQEEFPFNTALMPATAVFKLTVESLTAKACVKRGEG